MPELHLPPAKLPTAENLYAYVENDPINRRDPMGLISEDTCRKACWTIFSVAQIPILKAALAATAACEVATGGVGTPACLGAAAAWLAAELAGATALLYVCLEGCAPDQPPQCSRL